MALVFCGLAACGKKGPPLAPLRFVPGPATGVKASRSANEVRLQFVVPTINAEGQGPLELDRLEVFAVTVAAESNNPPNRDLLVASYLVGTIPVKPLPIEGKPAPAADASKDPRPAPGEVVSFVEELNQATLTPQITTPAAPEILPATPTAAAAAAAMAAAKAAPVVRRIYTARGLTKGGRPGQPSARVILPLIELPPAPAGVDVTFTETALTVSWTAPPVSGAATARASFNIYRPRAASPLNAAPLTSTTWERVSVAFGTEECFVVRTAVVSGTATLESPPSASRCITPTDIFPPAAPKGLSAVGVAGAINLIWDANTESDLGGYLILRGEAPGDTLQAITPAPVQATTYSDMTVKPGVRYVYAIVAVDRTTPPNTSPQSARVEESGR